MFITPIQIGAIDGIIIFIEIPENFNIIAKDIATKLENKKLTKRNFILLSFLIGNLCGGICIRSCGGIFTFSLEFFYFSAYNFSQIISWNSL